MMATIDTLARRIRDAVQPLTGAPRDYDQLMALVGNARVVVLGASTQGSHEFHRERAQITKRLIREKHFNAVAVDADLHGAGRINRFVRDTSDDEDAVDALASFRKFPPWLWRNVDLLDFIGWLRAHNDAQPAEERKIGIHGLDHYGLHASFGAALDHFGAADPDTGRRLRDLYRCIDQPDTTPATANHSMGRGLESGMEQIVIRQLVEWQATRVAQMERGQPATFNGQFCAERNARIRRNAGEYYQALLRPDVAGGTKRATHTMEALTSLMEHLDRRGSPSRVVVWAHSTTGGDARGTDRLQRGGPNLGQLLRDRFGPEVRTIGLTTHAGTVTAAKDWNAPALRRRVRAALPGSYEALFHDAGHDRFWLSFERSPQLAGELRAPRLERAIGVIYRPETERLSHYVTACLPDQYDAILHIDETRAVEPLERTVEWEIGDVDDAFPTGL